MEDEDEEALEAVEDGEHVRHGYGVFVDVQQAKRPGETKQNDQNHGTKHPRPASRWHTLMTR